MTDFAQCPKCKGTARIAVLPEQDVWKRAMRGYDKITDTLPCCNCGGQAMYGRAWGLTRINPATGLGCMHTFIGTEVSQSLYQYTCKACKYSYQIDSSG